MRHFLFVVIIIILVVMPIFSYSSNIGISTDLAVVDAIWNKSLETKIRVDVSLTKELSLSIPLSYSLDFFSQYNLFGANLDVTYHPLQTGPYVSLSLYSFVWILSKELPKDLFFSTSQLSFGYTWEFYKGMFIEPSIIIRNPCNVFTDFKKIQGFFPKYNKVRGQLMFGYIFKDIFMGGKE